MFFEQAYSVGCSPGFLSHIKPRLLVMCRRDGDGVIDVRVKGHECRINLMVSLVNIGEVKPKTPDGGGWGSEIGVAKNRGWGVCFLFSGRGVVW
jgi:hypothetical protein